METVRIVIALSEIQIGTLCEVTCVSSSANLFIFCIICDGIIAFHILWYAHCFSL